MNATGLPIATASTPSLQTTAEAAPSAATPTGQVPADFMLALAQMVGATPQTSGVEAQIVAGTTGTLDDGADSEEEDAAALALLSLPVAPLQPQPAQSQATDADPLEMLGLNPRPDGPSARDAALLQALTERLAAGEATHALDAPTAPVLPSIDSQQPVRASADGAITRPVHVPVGTPAWADEIGSRMMLMTEKGQHTASLRLSPEHLGPLEVRISIRDDQASVWFGAAHADTRAAIEHALPRLREMFTAQGMSLADAGVFREPPRQQMPTFSGAPDAAQDNGAPETVSSTAQARVGLVDAYA